VLASLKIACEKIGDRAADQSIGGLAMNGEPIFGRGTDWRPICDDAKRRDSRRARAFFEQWFEPVSINGAGEAEAALYTAYFEPELRGSRVRGGPYQYPIYAKPSDLRSGTPYFTRAQIQRGALAGKALELFWVDDPVEAFFLEIQGSGRIRLPDGRVARVGFAGKNGHSYKAIGKTLVEWNELALEQVSAQSIKEWIRANPARRDALLATNESYVFFIERPELAADPSLGPIGTFGQPLPAMRSIAVDRRSYALGIPFWIDFESPVGPMRRLVIALDTGGAIKGSGRADFFFGSGDGPGEAAGKTRARGRLIALAPTAALRRVFKAGS
jgi:membrane-bound lytic murein transglycosylase A